MTYESLLVSFVVYVIIVFLVVLVYFVLVISDFLALMIVGLLLQRYSNLGEKSNDEDS